MADFLGMMKQAAQLQSKMQEMQAELETTIVEGISGGGMVSVTLNGKGDLQGIAIDGSLLKPDEKEIVEDLIVAAHADAKRKLDAKNAELMREAAGPLAGMPGMPKLF